MTSSDYLVCPDCRHSNILGADSCDKCGQALAPLSHPRPKNELERQIVKDQIGALAPRTAVTVPATLTVREGLKLLVDKKIGCLLVEEQGRVVGIFTERDVLLKINADIAQHADKPIAAYMSTDPVSLKSRDRIAYAIHQMDLGGYRHVPILDDNLPAKVISVRDILRYMTERLTTA